MTQPRKALICIDETPYYHITTRCVRRACLCGVDDYSGRNYEHRRQWIVDRVRLLSSLFAIDLAAYAVMSNHYHLVLKLCPEQLGGATDDDIIERWCSLFKGPVLVRRYRAGASLSQAQRKKLAAIVAVWREKLSSISWFMRCLNQPIAFKANREDECRGKFWESRFTSQALKSEDALLSCMAYVDLNPIRAAMAATPEDSDYTSIQERIAPRFTVADAIKEQVSQGGLNHFSCKLKPLLPFNESIVQTAQTGIPFALAEYLKLIDWTGRAIRDDKRGAINSQLPPILDRLSIPRRQWLKNTTQFEANHYHDFVRGQRMVNSS